MKLNPRQKAAIAVARPDSDLVRIAGQHYAAVWHEPDLAPACRWRGQLVKEVILGDIDPDTLQQRLDVWWTGNEFTGRTRRAVVDLLTAEALR